MGWETILTNANVDNYSHSHTYDLGDFTELGAVSGELLTIATDNIESSAFTIYSVYYLAQDGIWKQSDATTDGSGAKSLIGLAVSGTILLISGYCALGLVAGVMGSPLYLSTSSGSVTVTAPYEAANSIRIIGYLLGEGADYSIIRFNPDSVWLELSVNEV